MRCRFCNTKMKDVFASLGVSPLANRYLRKDQLNKMEPFFPLTAYVCSNCFLVQVDEFETPENIFSEYAYFSSYSQTWLNHCHDYTEQIIQRLNLGPHSQVIEVASNDGYLLQYFQREGIPVLGIEPAGNVAEVAIQKGIPTDISFFSLTTATRLVQEGFGADLLIGNNVLAHVPNINNFVQAMKLILKNSGVITIEFPHLLRLIEGLQFDTIYHEHFSYFSLNTVQQIFRKHGLKVFDVEELPTHGGSLRIYVCHDEEKQFTVNARVKSLLRRENGAGLRDISVYTQFDQRIRVLKREILSFLIKAKNEGKTIAAYGAAAKGNTLLNFCGIRTDFLECIADKNPHKQGLYLPGSRIPIVAPEEISKVKPNYLLILPWNIKEEIMREMDVIRQWQGRFVTTVPRVEVL